MIGTDSYKHNVGCMYVCICICMLNVEENEMNDWMEHVFFICFRGRVREGTLQRRDLDDKTEGEEKNELLYMPVVLPLYSSI